MFRRKIDRCRCNKERSSVLKPYYACEIVTMKRTSFNANRVGYSQDQD